MLTYDDLSFADNQSFDTTFSGLAVSLKRGKESVGRDAHTTAGGDAGATLADATLVDSYSYYQSSRITMAIACSAVCDRERETCLTPKRAAYWAATPEKAMVGRLPGWRRTSTCCQVMPWRSPVPRALSAASLAAKRAAKRSILLRLELQYATSAGVKTRRRKRWPKRSTASATLLTSVISTPVPTIISALPSTLPYVY